MASDFEYTGIENSRCGFREKSTGMQYWLSGPEPGDAAVELLAGDQVAIPFGGRTYVWSIREARVVG